jgi:hypothetical protein
MYLRGAACIGCIPRRADLDRPVVSPDFALCNQDMLNAIATEYQKGRLLLIGTTNLDATPDNMENRGNCGERQSR